MSIQKYLNGTLRYIPEANETEWDGEVTTIVCDLIDLMNRRVKEAASVPTTGTWILGDVVWNSSPTPGGTIGWVCTIAGTPGTWKTFGVITS
jgi:hypothetical protein